MGNLWNRGFFAERKRQEMVWKMCARLLDNLIKKRNASFIIYYSCNEILRKLFEFEFC